jgi:hypothetical protein
VTSSRSIAAPIVSVVLPFCNAGDTLAQALDSLRRQTLSAFECLLIDNESTDDSASIAHAVCDADARFHVLLQPGDLVDALNAGIAGARGPFLARMDADDLAAPHRLERQLALLQSDASLSIASCLVSVFPDAIVRDGMRRYLAWSNSVYTPDLIRGAAFVESPLVHPSVMMRRSTLVAAGGYTSSDGPEDYDLWLRLLVSGHRAAKVPEVLLHWRERPQRLTRTDARYTAVRIFATKLRHFPSVVAPGTPVQICGAGPIGRMWAHALRERGYPVRRFVDVDARKHGRRICGAVVESPAGLNSADGFVLAAVGVPGARPQIESYLQQRGLQPWKDYLAVA